jgi:hypothetical protein
MTRRERLEKKLEKREEWAEKAHERASEEFGTSSDLIKDLPAGQPILVGHHSEKAHRRLLERSGSHMDKGCEQYKLAKHHEEKAQGLARQLENTIFSDDEDAVERLQEKLDDRRKRQDGYKKINKIIRSKITPAEKLKEIILVGIIGEQTATELIEKGRTLPAYMLINNNSEIRRIEKRIEEIKRRQEQQAEAEQAGGVVARYWTPDCVTVTFAEKPEYSIIRALKDAGFYFSRGSWHGRKDALPECVRDLLPEESEAQA